MATRPSEAWRKEPNGNLRRLRDGFENTPPPPPPPPTPGPWYSHIDTRIRSGPYPSGAPELSATGVSHSGSGYDPFELYLKDSLTARGLTVPAHVGQFIHEYSGQSHPSSFAASKVASAQSKGVGAMLNTKLDWNNLDAGVYDSLIAGFYNSWPVGVFGEVTVNHEPENDSGLTGQTQGPSNPNWVAWANVNAPIWKSGINHYIDVAAPIIRARGLDVKIGGCLMDFSWDSTRYTFFDWWNYITPANINEVAFQADIYTKSKTVTGGSPVWVDLQPRLNQFLTILHNKGITSMSFWETGIDRRNSLGSVSATQVGTESTLTTGWDAYSKELNKIPEMRMCCYYHLAPTPTTSAGPASAYDYMTGTTITKYADICMAGRRSTA